MSRFRLLLLVLLPLAALLLARELYSATAQAALGRTLDRSLGPLGSELVPLLQRLGPDISQGIGAFLHARGQWGWSWPAALVYGFPGVLLAAPFLVLGLAWLLLRPLVARIRRRGDGKDRRPPPEDGQDGHRPD